MIIEFNLSNMNHQVRKHCKIKVQASTPKTMKKTTLKVFKWQYITFSILFWIHFNMSWFLRELPVHQAWVIIHFLLEIWILHFYSYGWPKSLFLPSVALNCIQNSSLKWFVVCSLFLCIVFLLVTLDFSSSIDPTLIG